MQQKFYLALLLVTLLPLAGCLEESNETNWGPVGSYSIDYQINFVQAETKTDYYQNEEIKAWSVESSTVSKEIEEAGGNVIGILMELSYGEDETANFGCTGTENNEPDTIFGTVEKNSWNLTTSGTNPGSHEINLTWHNDSLLVNDSIEGLSEKEIYDELYFGDESLGSYNLSVIVEANAFDGLLCSHSDNGEEVTSVVSIIVLDFNIKGDETTYKTYVNIGENNLTLVLFLPWFGAAILLVGYITTKKERFQLNLVLEDDDLEKTELDLHNNLNDNFKITNKPWDGGETLIDSYRARVLTLCGLYVAQGIPWGFITVTFVTFLAGGGVGAQELALLLTVSTAPWSVKFLWGPIIDRFQYPKMGKRRPWILIAQSGMVVFLSLMLLVPDPANNVMMIAALFFVYNIFTSLQDVATDALAVDILPRHEIEKVNSYMFTSKSIGGMIGGAGLGTIIGIVGIKGALLLQIPILIGIMMIPIFVYERPGEKRFPWSPDVESATTFESGNKDFEEILRKIKTAFSLKSGILGIVLSLTVSLSFFLIPVLPLLFVRELGWSEEEFNATKGGIILIITMAGYVLGGQLGKRFGGKLVIVYSALSTALVTMTWGLTEDMWGNGIFMMAIWSLRTFGWAVVMINIYSLMMKITWGEVGGTQFTGYMAMMNLSAIIGYQLTAPIAGNFDYSTLFYIAAILETLVILAVLFIDPEETDRLLNNSNKMEV